MLAGNSSISLAGSEEQIIFFQQSLKILKIVSENFIHALVLFYRSFSQNFPLGAPENRARYQVSSLSKIAWFSSWLFSCYCFCLLWVSAFLVSVVLVIFFYSSVGLAEYLTIFPRVRMCSESIAHEAEGRVAYRLRGHEGERSNCFSKIHLVGQKYRE